MHHRARYLLLGRQRIARQPLRRQLGVNPAFAELAVADVDLEQLLPERQKPANALPVRALLGEVP